MTQPQVPAAAVRAALDEVIGAMQRAGVWDVSPPPDEAFQDMGAFGTKTMAFAQWLRWVFVPRVTETIASDGPWPRGSQVAVQAVREGDTDPAIASLVTALSDFDSLFEGDRD